MRTPTMRKLRLDDVEWTLRAEPEHTPIEGNALASGDDDADRQAEDDIRRQLDNGNEWAWCVAVVTGRWNGLEEDEALGTCSYSSAEDFKQPGGYYDDMRAEILDRLQEQAERIAGAMGDE